MAVFGDGTKIASVAECYYPAARKSSCSLHRVIRVFVAIWIDEGMLEWTPKFIVADLCAYDGLAYLLFLGRRKEAEPLVGEIDAGLTEGGDIADLQEAGTQLEELS